MVARTAKFMGSAYSTTGSTISLEVEYNNVVVFSGTVAATTQDPLPRTQPNTDPGWEQELFTFETDTDLTGQVPSKITVNSGILFFGHFLMNYTGNFIAEPDPTDPSTIVRTPVAPVDFYADPNVNTVESDGISNGAKNGVAWDWRVNVGDQLGNWAYPVSESEIFTFDFYVDPALIVTTPYTPPN
jgi:hypothetical protein